MIETVPWETWALKFRDQCSQLLCRYDVPVLGTVLIKLQSSRCGHHTCLLADVEESLLTDR